ALSIEAVQSAVPALQEAAGAVVARAARRYQGAVGVNEPMSTSCLFRDDAYLDHCTAKVVEIGDQGIVLDRTVFYATSGGQPGDRGTLTGADGTQTPIATAVYADAQKSVIAHAPAAAGVRPAMGDELAA